MKQELFHAWVGINNLANGKKLQHTNFKYCKYFCVLKKIKEEKV